MKGQLENGVGKYSLCDHIIVIDKYLVSFFGDLFVTSIERKMMPKFTRWPEEKMDREPRASKLKSHHSAYNRTLDETVALGYMDTR